MSKVFVLVRAELRMTIRHTRPLMVMIAIFATVLLIAEAVVGAGVARYAAHAEQHSALNLIEVSSVAAHSRRDITDRTIGQVKTMPHVVAVHPWYQHDLELADSSSWPSTTVNPGALWASPVIPGLQPALVAGRWPKGGLTQSQIVLPETVPGGSLRALLGHVVRMSYTKVMASGSGEPAYLPMTVVGIADNSTPGADGPTPSYVSDAALRRMNGGQDPLSYTTAYVQADTAAHVPKVQQALAREGFAVSSLASQAPELTSLLSILSGSVWVLLVVLLGACIIAGSASGAAWLRRRYADIGLLKAIGWTPTQIGAAVSVELLVAGLVASVTAVVVGCGFALLATTLAADANMVLLPIEPWQLPPTSSIVITLLVIPICVWIGAIPQLIRASRLDPDDVLRDTR